MVTKYGFSTKLGPVNYSSSEEVFLGKDFTSKQNYSEETASEIDEEVKAIIVNAYARAEEILMKHKKQLDSVAKALLELETLDGNQFQALYAGKTTAKKLAEEVKEQEHLTRIRNAEEAEGMKKLIARQEEEESKMDLEPDDNVMPSEDELSAYDSDYFKEDKDQPEDESKGEALAEPEEEVSAESKDEELADTLEKPKKATKKTTAKKAKKKDE